MRGGGLYYGPPGSHTSDTLPEGLLTAYPLPWPEQGSIGRLGLSVFPAGSEGALLRFGIYLDDNGSPGALLVDGGTASADSTGGKTVILSGVSPEPGVLWVAGVTQGAADTRPGVPRVSGALAYVGTAIPGNAVGRNGYTMSGVSGALPDPFVVGGDTSTAMRVLVRRG